MRDTTVAARYAKALFFVTKKRKETARALQELQGLRQVFAEGTSAARFLASPRVRLQDKREVLKRSLRDKAVPVVGVFLDLLLRKKRLGDFDTIVTEFEALVERAMGIQRASLVSAAPLSAAETKKVQAAIESYTRKKVRLTTEVDPDLIGGALVRIGDRVVDRSVRTLLRTIQDQLSEVSV